jgi:8-oxo-dGTP pyrophosphatase MutT (NUDIX family)
MKQTNWHKNAFYRVSIKAVICNDNGKVLFVKEKNNPDNWNLPGGGMDYGESEYDALKRELLEEVGYKDDFEYVPLGIRPGYLEHKEAWQLWVVYKVNPDTYDFSVGEEANEIAFLDPSMYKDSKPYIYEFCELARNTSG